jgi:hypothetical protein
MLLSKWILLQLKTSTKKIKIALSNCTEIIPQTTDREVAAMILTPSILKFLDLGFRTLSGEDPNQGALSGYYQKANKGDISL